MLLAMNRFEIISANLLAAEQEYESRDIIDGIYFYKFMDQWHAITQKEYDAIERSGKSNWEEYRFEEIEDEFHPTYKEKSIEMYFRPGKTIPTNERVIDPITPNAGRAWGWNDVDMLLFLRSKGHSWDDIAETLGRTISGVQRQHDLHKHRIHIAFNTAKDRIEAGPLYTRPK